ncbi:hypothetical protein DL238_04775 [Alteriqipengyuania lutimaris]|uniref:Uncharacterized protein n=1 Tax=Alteriqipengyuania lutimaris TaxID=1538146 RepID=A0A395LKS4_9SPHN|nr:hypothetical protein [Alteriqipengyuania lutimaris]RDS76987.1 hypothetical protein DL238_04775 [Alteriqipengyuania lutimaris]
MERELASAGLVLSLVGVLLLFRFGMPFAIATGGALLLSTEPRTADERREKRYKVLGYLGLFAIVVGTALQIWAIWSH